LNYKSSIDYKNKSMKALKTSSHEVKVKGQLGQRNALTKYTLFHWVVCVHTLYKFTVCNKYRQ